MEIGYTESLEAAAAALLNKMSLVLNLKATRKKKLVPTLGTEL